MRGVLVLLLLAGAPWASATAQTRNPVEEHVRALDDQERLAVLKRDFQTAERLWSENITVNAPSNQVVSGRQALLDAFVKTGIINFSTFDRQVEFIRADGDMVIIMGLETLTPVSDAPAAGLVAGRVTRRRFTNIWKKEGAAWRLYARHANVLPTP